MGALRKPCIHASMPAGVHVAIKARGGAIHVSSILTASLRVSDPAECLEASGGIITTLSSLLVMKLAHYIGKSVLAYYTTFTFTSLQIVNMLNPEQSDYSPSQPA